MHSILTVVPRALWKLNIKFAAVYNNYQHFHIAQYQLVAFWEQLYN